MPNVTGTASVIRVGAANMKSLWIILSLTVTGIDCVWEEGTHASASTNGVVFRESFTLKLHVDCFDDRSGKEERAEDLDPAGSTSFEWL